MVGIIMKYKLTFIVQYQGNFESRETHFDFKEIESSQDVEWLYDEAEKIINNYIETIGSPIVYADNIIIWEKTVGIWTEIKR
jgi:hypothetical protein